MNYFKSAKEYFNNGQFDYALMDCEYALKICRNSSATEISEFKEKIIERKTATYTYSNAEKCRSLASAAMLKGDYDFVIKAATKAIKLHRSVPIFYLYDEMSSSCWSEHIEKVQDSYVLRALAYFEKGYYDLVLEDCRSARKLERKTFLHCNCQILRAKACLKKEDYNAALAVCEKMEWANPDFYTIGAEAYLKKGYYSLAIENCRKAIEVAEEEEYCMDTETSMALNYFIRSQAYFLSGNAGTAFEDCDLALKDLAEREWEISWVGVGSRYCNDLRCCSSALVEIRKIRKLREEITKYSEILQVKGLACQSLC